MRERSIQVNSVFPPAALAEAQEASGLHGAEREILRLVRTFATAATLSRIRKSEPDGKGPSGHNDLMQFDDVKSVLAALEREKVDYVLVGGVALGLHGLERPTVDIDVFIRLDAGNVERLKAALRFLWKDSSIEEIRFEDLSGDYPVIRYGPPTGEFFIDIMGRVGTEIAYQDLTVERVEIEGVPVRIASPASLYRMKKATLRPIDRIDAERLKEKFKLSD